MWELRDCPRGHGSRRPSHSATLPGGWKGLLFARDGCFWEVLASAIPPPATPRAQALMPLL